MKYMCSQRSDCNPKAQLLYLDYTPLLKTGNILNLRWWGEWIKVRSMQEHGGRECIASLLYAWECLNVDSITVKGMHPIGCQRYFYMYLAPVRLSICQGSDLWHISYTQQCSTSVFREKDWAQLQPQVYWRSTVLIASGGLKVLRLWICLSMDFSIFRGSEMELLRMLRHQCIGLYP